MSIIARGVVYVLVIAVSWSSAFAQPAPDHGDSVALGTIKAAGMEFSVTRFGEITPGKEGAFTVELATSDKKQISKLNLYLWVEDEEGSQISAPAKGTPEGEGLHFHITPRSGGNAPKRVTLRVRKDGVDERGSLPLDGHGHEHAKTPHDGVVASLRDEKGTVVGFLELKLHDDKGDLEAWLAQDDSFSKPFDLPVESELKVRFIDVAGKSATLKARDRTLNKDEDGKTNVRNGQTNYFIFPGNSGSDASWLQGREFQSIVEVSFAVGGMTYKSEEFMLIPHTHSDGSHH